MATNKIILGTLFLVILTSSLYFMLPEKIRIDFENTRTIFKIYENGSFITQGTEYVNLFNGSRKLLASSRKLEYLIIGNTSEVTRTVKFKNTTLIDTYLFDGNSKDIETVPVDHTVCFLNGKGLIFEYLISGVKYDGITKVISSPFTLGKLKIYFQEGYYSAKIFNQATDKIQIRYKITSNNECFEVRLFDPEVKESEKKIIDNKDGSVLVGKTKINYTGRYCVLVGEKRIDCVKENDGLHKPDKKSFKGCQKEGGMNCYVLILSEDLKTYSLSKVNSDKFVEGKTKVEVKNI